MNNNKINSARITKIKYMLANINVHKVHYFQNFRFGSKVSEFHKLGKEKKNRKKGLLHSYIRCILKRRMTHYRSNDRDM